MPNFTVLAVLFPHYQNLTYVKQQNVVLIGQSERQDQPGNSQLAESTRQQAIGRINQAAGHRQNQAGSN